MERIEIGVLQYEVHGTVCAAATPTVSTVFHPSQDAKFHANMATLETPTCFTCSERFPDLHFHSKSKECVCVVAATSTF